MFDLSGYMEERRVRVDAALDRLLPRAEERPAVLHEAMRYAVFSGGKRLRPVLCLAVAEAVARGDSAFTTDATLAGVAVELLHTYTLVHDDLPCMDDDNERRGKPTVHVAFGEANAVLAGDALQALAFGVAARVSAPPPYSGAMIVAELAEAGGSRGVVGGQVEDIEAAGMSADAETVAFIHRHKTADLFRAAARMGAMAAGAAPDELDALTVYAVKLGLAFQIADDLLDRDDAGEGAASELTCLSVYTPEEAARRARALVGEAQGVLSPFAGYAEALRMLADYAVARTF